MKDYVRAPFALALAGLLVLGLAGCTLEKSAVEKRNEKQSLSQLSVSLEKENLKKKLQREENSTAIRYVYLMNYGKIVGYYVIKGKVSSSGSQMGPEEEVIRGYGGDGYVVDSSQDDGTYGDGDPGIFFFTTEGTMVETSLDYVISDTPLTLDVPRLQK